MLKLIGFKLIFEFLIKKNIFERHYIPTKYYVIHETQFLPKIL